MVKAEATVGDNGDVDGDDGDARVMRMSEAGDGGDASAALTTENDVPNGGNND